MSTQKWGDWEDKSTSDNGEAGKRIRLVKYHGLVIRILFFVLSGRGLRQN